MSTIGRAGREADRHWTRWGWITWGLPAACYVIGIQLVYLFIIADLMGEVSSDGVLLASLLGFGVTWFHIARLDPDIRGRPVAVTSIITAVVTVAALVVIEI